MKKEQIIALIKNHKKLLLLVIILGIVLWKNIDNRVIGGCGFEDDGLKLQQGYYKITDKSVCYHNYCDRYEGGQGVTCALHEALFGYQKVEGADPETFVSVPGYSLAMDKEDIYSNGERGINHISPAGMVDFINNFKEYCGDGDRNVYPNYNDPERMRKMCEIIQKALKKN